MVAADEPSEELVEGLQRQGWASPPTALPSRSLLRATSSDETRWRDDWTLVEPGLIRDLEAGHYFDAVANAA